MIAQMMSGLGGVAGAYGGYQANKNAKRTNNAIMNNAVQMQGDINATGTERLKTLGEQYAPLVGNDFAGDTQKYYNALDNADFSQFNLQDPGQFEFDQQAETQRQLNPELQAIIDRSTGEVTNSAANAGKLFSGAAGKNIARSTADIQAKEWGEASNRAQQQYQNKYGQWKDKFDQARLIAESGKNNLQAGLNTQGAKFGIQSNAFGQKIGAEQGVQNAMDTAILQSKQQGYDASAANKGLGSNFMAALTGGIGGASNAFGAFGGGTK